MTKSRGWHRWMFCGLAVLTGLAVARGDDEKVLSVEQVNAAKDHWSDWIDQQRSVEGRVSAVSKFQFRMVHCDLTFHVSEDQSRLAGNGRNVEVSGRIKKDKMTGKLFFAVDRLKILPSDIEQFDARESKLKSTKPDDWYELAEWAESRGKYYNDDDLHAKARRAWLKGAQFERAGLPADNPEARFALSERLKTLDLDPSLQVELLHEGARLKWRAVADDKVGRDKFAAWLGEVFPDSATPVKEFPSGLERRYDVDPLRTFREADESTRTILTRLLMIQVELARILPSSSTKESNEAKIADELTARVPERTDLIKKYREGAFHDRLKEVASATRSEAIRLADELKSRKQETEARELLRGWVESREPRLRKDGPIGLMQLADDYLQLAEDEPAAVRMLAEAHRLDPSLEDAENRLKQLGYRLDGDQWVKGDAPPSSPTGKGAGQLAVGMTADQIMSLLGAPSYQSRVISGSGTHEVWSFGRRGTSRLLIYLHRSPAAPSPRVTRFSTEN